MTPCSRPDGTDRSLSQLWVVCLVHKVVDTFDFQRSGAVREAPPGRIPPCVVDTILGLLSYLDLTSFI